MLIEGNTVDILYWRTLYYLLAHGKPATPRGFMTKEEVGIQLCLANPNANVVSNPYRKLNYPFSVAEWLWIMTGSNDGKLIVPYNSVMKQFMNNWGTFDGAYGPRFVEQLPFVLNSLADDPDSRQAVIDLWVPRPRHSKDIPCTLSLQFLSRENPEDSERELHLIVTMRSNDAWLGLPYDLFNFTQLQRYLAMLLGIGVGTYTHNVGSLHLYHEHWEKAKSLVDAVNWNGVEESLIDSPPLTRMPDAFKAVMVGLPLMYREGSANDIISWVKLFQLPDPWQLYLELLAYRFHKQVDLVPAPYQELIRAQTP